MIVMPENVDMYVYVVVCIRFITVNDNKKNLKTLLVINPEELELVNVYVNFIVAAFVDLSFQIFLY